MWTKYEYVCTNCDSLFEITTVNLLVSTPTCLCENPQTIRINRFDVTEITENHLDIIGESHYT